MARDPTYVNKTDPAYPKLLSMSTAVGYGHLTAIRWLIDAGADVNLRQPYGSLLGAACRDADVDVVRLLLDASARLNPRDPADADVAEHVHADWTGKLRALLPELKPVKARPAAKVVSAIATRHLLRAIETGDRKLFDEALRRKPNLTQWNFRYSRTALELAVVRGDAQFVTALLQARADPDHGQTTSPIHVATEAGRLDLVRALLAAGADIEWRNGDDRTPLMVAAGRGDQEMVRELLAAGAKKSARSRDTATAARMAGINGHVALANELDPSGKAAELAVLAEGHRKERLGEDLFEAIRKGDVARVERLLAEGANPRAVHWGESMLHFAAVSDERIVEILLAAGADPRAGVRESPAGLPDGTTPLHRAAVWGHDEATRIARRLFAAGADVDARDSKGTTPLAAGAASPAMVATLLELGADPNAADNEGTTALMRGAEALRMLRQVRADAKEIGRDDASITGDTERALRKLKAHGAVDRPAMDAGAFHEAIGRGKVMTVRRFLDAGADVDRRFGDRTPLSLAAQEGRTTIVKLLLERGANPNRTEGDDGTTPLMRAAANGHDGIVALLLAAGADPGATDEAERDALSEARVGAREAGQPRRALIKRLEAALTALGAAPTGWDARPLSADSRKAVADLVGARMFTERALGELVVLESTPQTVPVPFRAPPAAERLGFLAATTPWAIADVDHRLAMLTERVAKISSAEGRRWLTAERARQKAALAEVHDSSKSRTTARKSARRKLRRHVVLLRGARWTLPVLYRFGGWNDAPEPMIMASVLAYWSDTYGADVVDLGKDTLELVVARPPTTARAVARAADEAFCFCPDVEDARGMVATDRWHFWWD